MNKHEISKTGATPHQSLSPSVVQPPQTAIQQQTDTFQPIKQQKQQQQPPQQQPQQWEGQQKADQQQASNTLDVVNAKWQQQVGAAKALWGKLTDDEILQSQGNAEKLAGLVKERYAINRNDAHKQVKKFLAD